MFEGSDTNILQRPIEFFSLEQDVFEHLKNCWNKYNTNNDSNNNNNNTVKKLLSSPSFVL